MKKFVFIAVFAASGLLFVSCNLDAIESATPQFKEASIQKGGSSNITSKVGDSIPTTNLVAGPGDDLLPIKPPKP